jgi:exopolysaccharide biosynthesis polyprenyl glycosylphosphotransferase
VLLVLLVLVAPVNELVGLYRPMLSLSRTRIVVGSAAAPFLGMCVVAVVQLTLKSQDVSRLLIYMTAAFSAVAFAFGRLLLWVYYRKRSERGFYSINVLLIGSTASLEWLVGFFRTHRSGNDRHLAGYLAVVPAQLALGDLACIGSVDELGDLLIRRPIQEVVAVQSPEHGAWLGKVVRECDYFRVPLYIVPEALLGDSVKDMEYAFHASPLQLPSVVLRPPHFDSDARFLKRLFDVCVSAVLLILLSPLFLAIALAIKITTPKLAVFYPWRVVGLKGKEFTGYKFTTMFADSDALKDALKQENEMSGPVFKIKDDPRVTPLGRFLRKFSLNELPQLWSVLVGHMSLVGPRPAFPHELAGYQSWHKRKLSVQPGITCLWQIRGRNKISNFDDWVRMDLEYIHHWSLWLDLKILVRTAWVVVRGTGS